MLCNGSAYESFVKQHFSVIVQELYYIKYITLSINFSHQEMFVNSFLDLAGVSFPNEVFKATILSAVCSTYQRRSGGYFPPSTLLYRRCLTLLSPKPSPSDVPKESQPSTSPFISSLSLSSSEENIGKKLLRKLSE